MSCESGAISEADLHAYVDGCLEEGSRIQVEMYLAAHPEEAQRLRDYQLIDGGLHALFDDVLHEPVPSHLLERYKRPRSQGLLRVAGITGWIVLGGMLGWFGHDQATRQTQQNVALLRQAVFAHAIYTPEVRHPVEVDTTQEQHLLAWLSKRLGVAIRAPHLNALGYELLGGRLLPADGRPAAQFMYQDAGGRRLTLFVQRGMEARQDTAFRFAQQEGVNAFYWIDGEMGYALIGELDKPLLAEIAHSVYQQLNL